MKPSEAVSKTIDLLKTRGWCQFNFENDAGACCLLGAINATLLGTAAGGFVGEEFAGDDLGTKIALYDLRNGTKNTIKHQIYTRLGKQYGILDWNDAPERNATEVVALLENVKFDFEAAGQ